MLHELLQKGEREAVLAHLDQIAVFWARPDDSSSLMRDHQKKIDAWKQTIRSGQIPDDHPWLVARVSSVDSSPVDQGAVRNARSRTCASQLRQIDVARQMWKSDHDKPDNAAPAVADLAMYLPGGKLPRCPDGGSYVLGQLNQTPRCSVAEHKLPKGPK